MAQELLKEIEMGSKNALIRNYWRAAPKSLWFKS